MKSKIWKSTFREIRQSFGRFFAIMAIVALGVGFFAGLKVTKSAMVATTQEYWEEQNFYDMRLMSTLGFEQQDVEWLRQQSPGQKVEGALSFDILYADGENGEMVLKAHSITTQINQLLLVEGRLPENAEECVVDSSLFSAESIGEKLVLSETNEEEDLEHFAYKEYTIVGTVQSPDYIQFERGNTSLGNGRISGYAYLMPEGFAEDFYTEIYVAFEEDYSLYSDVYENYYEEQEAQWEALTEKAAQQRKERLVTEAEEELAEAEAEFQQEKADAEEELAEAEAELTDAEKEIADGEAELADAETELADARKTLREKEAELADGETQLAEEEQKLLDGEQELQDGMTEWHTQKDTVESGKSELYQKEQELNRQKAELNQQLAALEEQAAVVESGLAQLTAQENALLQQFGTIPEPYATQIDQSKKELVTGQEQINQGRQQIASYQELIAAGERQIADAKAQLADADRQLAEAWQELENGQAELIDGRRQLEEAKQEIADGRVQIANGWRELEDGEQELAEAKQELADGRAEYEDGLKEYQDGLKEFQEEIAEAEAEIEDARQEIADIEEPEVYVLGRDTNVGYVCFENDSSIVDGIANVFPIFFFAVAALVCITTMNRMVEEQRTQIGVLKALGYGQGTIMGKYLFYSGAAAMLGCVGGFFGGTYLFPRIIWTAYGMMYQVKPLLYLFDWKLAGIALAVSMLCSLGTTWLSCRYELAEVAAELMRPKAPKAGKRVFLEKIPFIWKRMKFLHKVSYRNIFRYKKRFFMMIIGISGCTALLLTGFGVRDSITNVADQQFGEIQIYDINVMLTDAMTESEGQALLAESSGIENQLLLMEKTLDLVTDKGVKGISLVVADGEKDITPFLNLHTERKESIAFPGAGEAVITHKIADTYDIEVGDEILLRDDAMNEMTVTVSGINENFIYNYVYVSAATYEERIGIAPEYKTYYLNIREGADVHQLAADLMKQDEVASVTVNADTMERLGSMMGSLDLVVLAVILSAAGLALIVLYNLTNINITERIREIATIKVLGFYKKETAAYVFRENMVLTLFGTAVGLILGHFLHQFIMNEIQVDMITFDIQILPASFVYSILLTFLFTGLVNLLMRGKLERISMTESLKSVD